MSNLKAVKYTSFLILLLLQIIFANSCNSNNSGKQLKEGEIEYDIKYLDDVRQNPLIALLPKKMKTVFKDNSTYSLIEGFMFKFIYITNHEKGQNITLFQILDKKYSYLADTSEVAFGYKANNKAKIIFTSKEKTISGYKCHNALAIFPNSLDTLEIYYTNELGIENPNCNNPYKQIKGVLMEFSVKMMGINMKFIENSIKHVKVDAELFTLPKGYNLVSKAEMERIIDEYNKAVDK